MGVIVVANNFLSDSANNGKTLKHLFSNYADEELFWIYTTPLSSDLECDVDNVLINGFGSIYQKGMFHSQVSNNIDSSFFTRLRGFFGRYIKRNGFIFLLLRIVRDLGVYAQQDRILKLIEKSGFEAHKVVFVAGDFLSLHRLARRISIALNAPLSVFVTDDYIFKYSEDGKIANRQGFYQHLLRLAYKKTFSLSSCNHFISNKMLSVYSDRFDITGCLSFNSSAVATSKKSMRLENSACSESVSDVLKIRYFGSLHTGRDQALLRFVAMVRDFNERAEQRLVIEVFCDQFWGDTLSAELPEHTITFNSPVVGEQYSELLHTADCLLLLESADEVFLSATWLSFSTKVMEYMQINKPIVAFGPLDNPSIGELVSLGAALHVTKSSDFNFLFDEDYIVNQLASSVAVFNDLRSKNTLF